MYVSGAYKLVLEYRDFHAFGARLPNLPELRSITPARRDFPTQVWVHRVNSIERAVLMAKTYRGMEIDVVYDSTGDFFDVNHPPARSRGISLDAVLSSVPDVAAHYFWIDFKNLTDFNEQPACRRLTAIAWKHGIVHHMVVESNNPRALSCFTSSGFYTSYYLPIVDLWKLNPQQLVDYYEEVASDLKAATVNAISSDYKSLPFMQKYFPGADILVWYLKDRSLRYYAALAYLRSRDQVKIILVGEEGPGYR
jgi:hypothetical protein